MADSDLGSLRDRLRRSLEKEVTPLTQVEAPAAADFVRLLGSVKALKRLASDLQTIDQTTDPSDALLARRASLVASMETLVSEMES